MACRVIFSARMQYTQGIPYSKWNQVILFLHSTSDLVEDTVVRYCQKITADNGETTLKELVCPRSDGYLGSHDESFVLENGWSQGNEVA